MSILTEQRAHRVNVIRRTLVKAKEQDELYGKIDEEKFIVEIMAKWDVNRTTAKDYLIVAGFKNDQEDGTRQSTLED